MSVLTLSDIDHGHVAALLGAYGLQLVHVDDGATIPGSYWGEPEAAAGIHPNDDLGEGLGTSWEAAWIDFGGEG